MKLKLKVQGHAISLVQERGEGPNPTIAILARTARVSKIANLMVAAPEMKDVLDALAEMIENGGFADIDSSYFWDTIVPALFAARDKAQGKGEK